MAPVLIDRDFGLATRWYRRRPYPLEPMSIRTSSCISQGIVTRTPCTSPVHDRGDPVRGAKMEDTTREVEASAHTLDSKGCGHTRSCLPPVLRTARERNDARSARQADHRHSGSKTAGDTIFMYPLSLGGPLQGHCVHWTGVLGCEVFLLFDPSETEEVCEQRPPTPTLFSVLSSFVPNVFI